MASVALAVGSKPISETSRNNERKLRTRYAKGDNALGANM